jgi:two-component system NtrC family sensor kinase
VVTDIQQGLPMVAINENQLEQVFINLLQNATDAFEKTHGSCKIAVRMFKEEDGRAVIITFSDNGIGIPAGNIGKIFEPFFTTKEVGKGTGLGLSIAYGIISEHNGTIACDSNPGTGTVFTITLPAEDYKKNA